MKLAGMELDTTTVVATIVVGLVLLIVWIFLRGKNEKPKYSVKSQLELYRKHQPLSIPKKGSPEYMELLAFSKNVQIILQTVNENEFQAAALEMGPPSATFKLPVVFPTASMVVGMFGRNKVALIQTDAGRNVEEYVDDAIATFPNVKYVIGVGVCYAFNRSKHQLGDVLVSKVINDLKNSKFDRNGELIGRGVVVEVVKDLVKMFCLGLTVREPFHVSDTRTSKVYSGKYVSCCNLVDNKEIRDKFQAASSEVIGGEMEGGELLRFQQKGKVDGIIVIKGVTDYGDGTKSKEWQFTAAKAALHYVKAKLNDSPLDDIVDTSTGDRMGAAGNQQDAAGTRLDAVGDRLGNRAEARMEDRLNGAGNRLDAGGDINIGAVGGGANFFGKVEDSQVVTAGSIQNFGGIIKK